jgi:hypothetical protein
MGRYLARSPEGKGLMPTRYEPLGGDFPGSELFGGLVVATNASTDGERPG